ncbi:MAG: FAD-dependent oxidoreductase [Synergistota bacterium]|nr:FAD-dependent oxidoreductase [Synergistota bacterium]
MTQKKIIVVGAGGAGLTAAIEASMAGADVTVITKTSAGLGTCTAYGAGFFTLPVGGMTREEHFTKTLEVGKGINDPSLVRVLSDKSEESLKRLAELGVKIEFTRGSANTRSTAPNELMGGAGFVGQLVEIAKRSNVKFIEWTVVTSLDLTKEKISGVSAVDWRTGSPLSLQADAVIIATGGGGQIYRRSDNPSRMTGDGYSLAKRAGLELIDMEFVQFYPIGWAEHGLPVWLADTGLVDHVRITDEAGDEFFLRAIKEWGYKNGAEANLFARDRCSVLMAKKEEKGPVFAHLEDVSDEKWEDRGLRYSLTIDHRFFDHFRRPVRISPIQHYMSGGIKIDTECRTEISGLFACGEATGGVDGANRIGGNAFSNIVTFGIIAGRNAAKTEGWKTKFDHGPGPASHFESKEGGTLPSMLRSELQRTMWSKIGPIRTEKGIRDALNVILRIRESSFSINSPYEMLLALEMQGLCDTAEAVAQAALSRKDSLGTHFREDS